MYIQNEMVSSLKKVQYDNLHGIIKQIVERLLSNFLSSVCVLYYYFILCLLLFLLTCSLYFHFRPSTHQSETKWKQLADMATNKCEFRMAQECLHKAQDFGGLLLLASCSGDSEMVSKLADNAAESEKHNIAFMAYFLQGK